MMDRSEYLLRVSREDLLLIDRALSVLQATLDANHPNRVAALRLQTRLMYGKEPAT